MVRSRSDTYQLLGSVENELVSHLLDIRDISTGIGAPASPWPEGSDGSFVGIGIGDLPPQSLTDSAVSELLRGAAGTPVKLVISRPGAADPLTFIVARERIPADARVLTAEYPNPKLGKRACFVIDRTTALAEWKTEPSS